MEKPHSQLNQAERDYRAVASNLDNLERQKLISAGEKQTLLARARNLFLN